MSDMNISNEKTKYTIDATGRSLGRVAQEAAVFLMGKNLVDYERHLIPNVFVNVINVSKIKNTQKKLKQKKYAHYSGYPGGLRYETMEQVISQKGYGEVMKRAVYGMLPTNKLRPLMMKNLIIQE